jgi:outer membrane cobalamin receptor
VTTLTREEVEYLSPRSLVSALEQLPQFVNNSTPDVALGWSGSVGQSLLNLRGIGSNRTLVLLDGRRLVPSTRRGTVDIGILPEALIDRVEIVTGGASAAYGSDAVAGVANLLLDTSFEGSGLPVRPVRQLPAVSVAVSEFPLRRDRKSRPPPGD